MELQDLEQELAGCSACPLRKDAIGPVGWYGNPQSPIVFVGEGPGGVEDDYGCPLIGPSGQLLDKALWATKMTRDRVLTTNIIKCRPKNNRTPDAAEASFCGKLWLSRELAIIKPKVVVALGSVALHYLGSSDMRITRDRGMWFKTEQGIDCDVSSGVSFTPVWQGAGGCEMGCVPRSGGSTRACCAAGTGLCFYV